MKVWVVEYDDIDHSYVVGVFSDEQRANNYIECQEDGICHYIYEMEIDHLCK